MKFNPGQRVKCNSTYGMPYLVGKVGTFRHYIENDLYCVVTFEGAGYGAISPDTYIMLERELDEA